MKPNRPNTAASASPANLSGPAENDPPAGNARWRGTWLPGVLLVVITFLVYLPVWRAGFIWDDDAFLTNNALIKQGGGLYRLWFSTEAPDYFPLTSTSLWVEWRLWGMNALGYHLTNVLLHAFSAVLWWRVLARLNLPGAWLAAAIFALHPVNVESVAWITERKNTLTMFFYALTFLWFLKAEVTGRHGWYWASVGGFLLALLSKTSAAPLPFVLLGLAWWRRGKVTRDDLLRSVPFFVLSLALGLVTMWFQANRAIGDDVIRQDGIASRLVVAGCAVWFYLYKALVPVNLSFVYPRWQIDAASVLSYVPAALLVAALWLCWRYRERWGRGWLFGLGYFVVLLLPVLGFVEIYFMKYSLVADHWQYFAILAPIAVVVTVLSRTAVFKKKMVAMAGGVALLLVLGILTGRQCGDYLDAATLWQATLAKDPNCGIAHNNYGAILLEQARSELSLPQFETALDVKSASVENSGGLSLSKDLVDRAMSHFRKSLEFNPDDVVGHNNYGNALFMKGDLEAALPHVLRALELQPHNERSLISLGNILLKKGMAAEATRHYLEAVKLNPGLADAHFTLGNALFQQGQLDEAIVQCQQALTLRADLADAREILGQALQRKGRLQEATAQFQELVRLRPKNANAHNNYGTILLQTGQVEAAITQFKTALAINPDFAEAHYNLGNALYRLGQVDVAITHLRRAQEIQPENASAHNNLGGILLQVGRTDEAVAQFALALKLRPRHAVTHNNLGRALLQQGNPNEAGVHFQKALEIQPDFVQAADNLCQAAWMLATSPLANVRNGKRAVELAQQLERFAGTNQPAVFGTLAAAYAESGRFSEAIACAGQAQQLAAAVTNATLVKDLQAHLALYRAGMSLRESDLTNSPSSPKRR